MIRRPPRSSRTDTLFPTRRSSDLFLCDRGRFGYGYTNLKDRPRRALVNGQSAAGDVALAAARTAINGANKTIAIGSPRASVEANYALRELVGAANFHDGHGVAEGALVKLALRSEEHTSELQSLMRISYAVFCL